MTGSKKEDKNTSEKLQESHRKRDDLAGCQPARSEPLFPCYDQSTGKKKHVCHALNWWCVFMPSAQIVMLGTVLISTLLMEMSLFSWPGMLVYANVVS